MPPTSRRAEASFASALMSMLMLCTWLKRYQATAAVADSTSSMAAQNDRKILRKSDLMSAPSRGRSRLAAGDQHIARAANTANFRQPVLAEPELAPQVADVRIDAAVVRREPPAE